MSKSLLNKTRIIGELIKNNYHDDDFPLRILDELSNLLDSNMIVIDKIGKLIVKIIKSPCDEIISFKQIEKHEYIESQLNDKLKNIFETKEFPLLEKFSLKNVEEEFLKSYTATVIPMIMEGQRLGSIILYKNKGTFTNDDILIGEYVSIICGLKIIQTTTEEEAEQFRKNTIVKSAIGTLSYSELEAIIHIFNELNGVEGLLIASKIADKVGITRSVIVSALRKLESAGIIESRSLGMKGTYIKVLNNLFMDELKKLKK